MRKNKRSVDTVKNLLVRLLDEMQPEISARKMQLDLDLDEVDLPSETSADSNAQRRSFVVAAIRGLLADAIESAGEQAELSVTLIDTDQSWELEMATTSLKGESVGLSIRGLPHLKAGFQGRNFAVSSDAATRCGGQVHVMECPQGGAARILVMPKRNMARIA